jgi:hypothetical protein
MGCIDSTTLAGNFFFKNHLKAMAATGNPEEGLRILAKLDALTE